MNWSFIICNKTDFDSVIVGRKLNNDIQVISINITNNPTLHNQVIQYSNSTVGNIGNYLTSED